MELPKLICSRCGHVWIPRIPRKPKQCPKCHSPYWRIQKWKGVSSMAACPICRSEHRTWTNMSTHMILKAVNERSMGHTGDDPHATYLDLFTGKDQHFWGHKHDATVGNVMKRYYRRFGRLLTLQELKCARGADSGIDI